MIQIKKVQATYYERKVKQDPRYGSTKLKEDLIYSIHNLNHPAFIDQGGTEEIDPNYWI